MTIRPVPDADTAPYWDGLAAGELRLQRCGGCGRTVFYPRAVCPHCFGTDLSWQAASGLGTIYSFTVAHRAFGDFAGQVPFTVALVDLDEGVRMMTRITGPDRPAIGDRVRLAVTAVADDLRLPYFTRTGEGGTG
ncbi:Zn-ribbon domain-containing OB-fold protein [Actinomadura sp. 21ATH]|uniref:Zn-ribbon domain-containing OB-fold protein n=1 Tax=Actinomadura sp. 21ATH TaxID=1735444 RepID=UPI0035C057C0